MKDDFTDPNENCPTCGSRLPNRLWDCVYIGSGENRVILCSVKCFMQYLKKENEMDNKEGKFPFKENSGTSKQDLDRGFCADEPKPDDIPGVLYPEDTGPVQFPDGGFLGRPKGWER